MAFVTAVLLLVANGFFVGSEFAFTASRRARIQQMASGGSRPARWALASMRELSLTLASAQLGITMASLGLGYVTEPALASMFERVLGLAPVPSGVNHVVAIVLGLLVVVFAHMVVGEMAPKNLAISVPERMALWLALPFRLYTNLFRPAIWLLNGSANLILRLFGVQPRNEIEVSHSADDIATMITVGRREGVIDALSHRLLSGAILFTERDAASVMVPRTDVVTLAASATPADIEEAVIRTGHSRIPLVGPGGIDDVMGYVHAKDLLSVPGEQRRQPLDHRLIRQMLGVPESAPVEPLLAEMRRGRNHLALVVDEHGGTAGIVSLEDIVEELVGEIRDEYDREDAAVRRVGMRRYLVPGTVRPDQLVEPLGLRLPDGDYETVGGFLMERLARVPRRGDFVAVDGWVLRVRRMDRRRVAEVEIERRIA